MSRTIMAGRAENKDKAAIVAELPEITPTPPKLFIDFKDGKTVFFERITITDARGTLSLLKPYVPPAN